MKKIFLRLLLILGYCIPFVFLAMNEDATFGTLWFYQIMAVGFGGLSYISAKSKNAWIIVIGNILSFVSTCLFAWCFQTEKWEYYFKPFLPNQLIIIETVIVFAVQIIIARSVAKKYKEGEKK